MHHQKLFYDKATTIHFVCKILVTNDIANMRILVAKKILRIIGDISEEDIANEISPLENLCTSDEGNF